MVIQIQWMNKNWNNPLLLYTPASVQCVMHKHDTHILIFMLHN